MSRLVWGLIELVFAIVLSVVITLWLRSHPWGRFVLLLDCWGLVLGITPSGPTKGGRHA